MNDKFFNFGFGIFLIGISIYDVFTLTIPDTALLLCFIVVMLKNITSNGLKDSLTRTIFAFGNGFLLTFVIYLTSNQGSNVWLGGGDIKLVALISFFIGNSNIIKFDMLLAGAIGISFISRSVFDISYMPFGGFLCGIYFLQKIELTKRKISVSAGQSV